MNVRKLVVILFISAFFQIFFSQENTGVINMDTKKCHAIKKEIPDTFLALNNTSDGIWGFMIEINNYQQEHDSYGNVFSKHSHA